MRLKQLKITAFKNLRDFAIDFDEDALTTVIVGRNGTGKSNILEALVIIFRDLLNEVFGKLMSLVGEKAEYSAAARAVIMSLRPNRDWLEVILTAS